MSEASLIEKRARLEKLRVEHGVFPTYYSKRSGSSLSEAEAIDIEIDMIRQATAIIDAVERTPEINLEPPTIENPC